MYDFSAIEAKWKEIWNKEKLYEVDLTDESKPTAYILDMFPYPSGKGLHVGHPKGYIATDIYSRFKRMNGHNVLHPMGWDAFGLPAENYALKTGVHPRVATEQNVANFKRQLEMFGFCYDWSKEVNTTDPEYYKWTQWIFLKLYEQGLAYEAETPINWCPKDKTGLANEEVVQGKCDRCGTQVERRNIRQWILRITEYADRLLDDLAGLDWPESIKAMQRNWIGKSMGVEMEMKVRYAGDQGEVSDSIQVFTTRIDTVYGMSFACVAPEHPIVEKIVTHEQREAVKAYIDAAAKKSDLERTELNKEKTGVFTGSYAVNPFNNHKVPIYVADYVLAHYGTGAVMGVPAHDERDYAFAEKHSLDISQVITNEEGTADVSEGAFTEDGILLGSERFSGMTSDQARVEMSEWLEEKGKGTRRVNYKLNDWVFSRQRYWGEPIPMVHCEGSCGVVPVPEEQLPVLLPEVDSYEPSDTGESPLANVEDWVKTTCPKCGGAGRRETNTMPQWGGSCWYYLRYLDPKNTEAIADKEIMKRVLPVDMYVGGAEHAVLHLLYARFWHKVLYDCGVVPTKEPFQKLKNQGLIMAEDGTKMSKSVGNVINPDDVINEHGADVFRVYEMFMGPFEQKIAWDTNSISGIKRFLSRAWSLFEDAGAIKEVEADKKTLTLMHKTIKKVTADVENFSFNTAISQLMVMVNELMSVEEKPKDILEMLVLLMAPFAPFIAEEMWQALGHESRLWKETWPTYQEELTKDDEVELVVQVNGKLRAKISVAADISKEDALEAAKADEKIQQYLVEGTLRKEIFVPGKLVNLVIS